MKELIKIKKFHTNALTSEEMINIKGGDNEWWRWTHTAQYPSQDCNGAWHTTTVESNWFGLHETGNSYAD